MVKPFYIRSKIWIEDDKGEVIFGPGRMKIFEAIRRHGTIQAAAKELGMSYRAVWGRIKATEERLGIPLLVRNVGGTSGGGSQLTATAEHLMAEFRRINSLVESESDKLFEKNIESQLVE
jgi:molybdate transport system regulatory protein